MTTFTPMEVEGGSSNGHARPSSRRGLAGGAAVAVAGLVIAMVVARGRPGDAPALADVLSSIDQTLKVCAAARRRGRGEALRGE